MIDITTLTAEEEAQVLAEAVRRWGEGFSFKSLEDLLVSPEGFGLETATALQRAICRIIQGAPLAGMADSEITARAVGYGTLPPPGKPPFEVVLLAGVRTAKSMIAAAHAIWSTQHANLDGLTDGEIARYSVVSLQLDNARVIHSHLTGALQKPALASLRLNDKDASKWRQLIDDTGAETIGSEFLWHPSGRPVEIRVVAGKRAGGSAVSRWSIGMCLDEAPRMTGASDHVVNYDDMYRAVIARLRPGASILSVGSPWIASGPIYDKVTEHFGSPSQDIVVIRGTGPALNPYWWTPERCEMVRRKDPTAYKTDVLAEFIDADEQLIPQQILKACLTGGKEPKDYNPRQEYVAAMDPATRKNAWTLTIHSRIGHKKVQVLAKEWQGTALEPLRPREILKEIKEDLAAYELDWVYTDQWSAEALEDLAQFYQLSLVTLDWTQKEKTEAFLSLLVEMQDGRIELMNLPNIERDLKNVRRSAGSAGKVSIQFLKTNDGRHCDYAPPIARALKQWIEEDRGVEPESGTDDYNKKMEEEMIAKEVAAAKRGEEITMEIRL